MVGGGGGGGRGEGMGDVCLWYSKEPDYEYVYRIRNRVPPTMTRIVVRRISGLCAVCWYLLEGQFLVEKYRYV